MATIAMVAARSSAGADWSETLDADLYGAYDTNPRLLPGSHVSDQSAQLIVDGTTMLQSELGELDLTPRFSATRYDRDTGLDIDTGSINLSYTEKLERGQWNLGGQVLTDSTASSELGTTGITDVNFRHYSETAQAGYQYLLSERLSWQLSGFWQGTRYNDAAQHYGLTDYDYGSIQSGTTWSFNELLLGSINASAVRITPQVGPVENAYSASLQLKRNLNAGYAWRVSAGATRVAAGRGASGSSSVFELGASRQGQRVQWDVSIRRAVLPIGLGLLAREDTANVAITVSTTEYSTLNLALSAIRSYPVTSYLYVNPEISLGFQVYSGASWGQASAEWQYHFTPRLALSVAYLESRARNNNVPQWADGNQARLGILWQSNRL